MDPAAFALLERWMDRRRALGLSRRRPVFCTLAGEPLDSSYVRRLLPRLARRSGIDSASTPTACVTPTPPSSRPRECRSTSSSSSSATGRSPPPTATCATSPPLSGWRRCGRGSGRCRAAPTGCSRPQGVQLPVPRGAYGQSDCTALVAVCSVGCRMISRTDWCMLHRNRGRTVRPDSEGSVPWRPSPSGRLPSAARSATRR